MAGRSTDFLFILLINNEIVVSHDTILWIISIDILSRIVFSRIILKTRIYLHHIVAFFIFIIGFLPMTIWGIIAMAEKKSWILLLFLIPKNIIFSFGDIISKILLTNKFVLPQNLMFYKGIYNFGMHIIIFFILFYFNKLDFEYFSDNLILKITKIIINIILLFSKLFCIMKIIYLFTPFHVAFVNLVVYLYNFIYHILFKNYVCNKIILIIIILGLMIVIFGILFNEIIIINACGFKFKYKT